MTQGSLAERLSVLRASKGLTLEEASEKIGISRHTLRRLELGGDHAPHYRTLRKIAEGYDVPVEELLQEAVELAAGKGEAPQVGPSEFSKALRAPRETMPLADLVGEERIEATTRELNRLYAQLEAGEITMPTYRARRDAAYAELFAYGKRASTEAG